MIQSELGIYKHDVAVIVARPLLEEPVAHHTWLLVSGQPYAATYLEDPNGKWVIVSCHEGEVQVIVRSPSAGYNFSYLVSPGFPLQHYVSEVDEFVVEMNAQTPQARVQLIVSSSPYHLADAPVDSFIINPQLTGAVDVDFFAQAITAFRDPRANTLAGSDFTRASGATAHLIASDPDFGGRPSIDFTGTQLDGYVNAAPEFVWLRGLADFTFMGVIKVQDVANLLADIINLWSNISSTASAGGGFKLGVDTAYRLYAEAGTNSTTPWKGIDLTTELAPKSTIFIMRYVAATKQVRLYWQGKWRSSFTAVTNPTTNSGMTIAGGTGNAAFKSEFKVADMTWLNRAASDTEMAAYITNAITEYGIDNAEVQTFPFVGSAMRFMRANRGWRLSTPWWDTREEGASRSIGPNGGANFVQDVRFNGQYAFQCNGVSQYGLGSESWDELGAGLASGTGVTLSMVVWANPPSGSGPNRAIISQSAYTANVAGTNIWFEYLGNRTLGVEVDNASGADVLVLSGAGPLTPYAPYLITMEIVKATRAGRIEITNLLNGSTQTYTTTSATVPAATVGSSPVFFLFSGSSDYLEGAMAEVSTLTRVMTDAERAALKVYALNRYGGL